MTLSAGSRIGHYIIVDTLGEGGMGIVYRARDERLKREVALKVLPPEVADDPERIGRFQREAELLAALSHPHIAAIFGIEQEGGTRALAMELVDGETLADKILRGPIPVGDALPLARQLVDALDYAHERGILHRDLKPANIKVTDAAEIKVLDFGLAKAVAETGAEADRPGRHGRALDLSHSPTVTSPALMTGVGVLLGTAAYMSPEQARGKRVDKRADIWAFGCVLFEMLTGRRAFEGETVSDTLASVLKSDPDWSRLPVGLAASVRDLLRRCLAREPKDRLRDIGDARQALDEGGTAGTERSRTVTLRPGAAAAPWAVAIAALAALVGVLALWAPWRKVAPAPLQRLSVELGTDASLTTDFGTAAALSPDGRTLVFAAKASGATDPQLFVRRLDQLQAIPLVGTEGARGPFFSPDGRSVAFFAAGKLKKVEVAGGVPVTLSDAQAPRGGGFWTSDDAIIFNPQVGGGTGLVRVSAAGGTAEPFTDIDSCCSQRWPQVLPGGALLFTRVTGGIGAEIVVQPLPSGPRTVVQRGAYGRYVSTGHLIYVDGGTVYAVPFDPTAAEVRGKPAPVLEGVSINLQDGAQFAVSDSGTLVYLPGSNNAGGAPIQWIREAGAPEPLRDALDEWRELHFDPAGQRLAYDVPHGVLADVYVYDIGRGATTRVTSSGWNEQPAWTPDGTRLSFSAAPDQNAARNIYWKRADGTGEAQRLTNSPFAQSHSSWHPSGRIVAFREVKPPQTDLMVVALDGSEATGWTPGPARPIFESPFAEDEPQFSPDGRWLAYTSSESGRVEVHVRPFPGPGGRVVISTTGGRHPMWSRIRPELFFTTLEEPTQQIMMVPYTIDSDSFIPGKARVWSQTKTVYRRASLNISLHPDGTRFAGAVAQDSDLSVKQDKLVFVFNFLDELTRLSPR